MSSDATKQKIRSMRVQHLQQQVKALADIHVDMQYVHGAGLGPDVAAALDNLDAAIQALGVAIAQAP